MSILRYVLLIFLIVSSSYALDDSNDLNLIRATKLKQVEGKKEPLNAVKKEYIAEVPGTSKLKTFNSDNNLDTKLYQKVKLIDVVLETLSRSDILKSSRESVIQNELKVKNAIADYYPTLNFNYEYGRTRTKPGENEGDKYKFYTDNNFEFILRQNLYSGNSTYNNIKSVSKKLEVARNQYRIKLDEEIKKAIKAYFDVVFTNRSVMVNERNMKKLNKILEIVTAKYESGAASIGDLTSIKANVANALTKLVKVKSKFVEALRYYEYIVGTQFQKTIPYEKNFNIDITDFDLLYQRALKKNRNLINYYKSIEAEKFNQKNKRSAFEPKIDFELAYGKTFDGEDIEEDETDVSGKVKFTYNLFNGGRDKNKVLEVNSKIRDLSYKLEEEKKKVKWNLSKIHTSVKTVRDALESTIEEIKASRKMVTAYWEAFKLGEQDLNTLLQGQRQLNSAETELVNFEKNQLVDFFNILELTGELSSFFDVNPDSSKFIDFSKSDYKKTVIAKDGQNLILVEKKPKKVIEEKKEEKPVVEIKTTELSLKEKIDNYLKQFINFDDESFMIVISDFDSIYDAFNFMIENDLDDNSFAYDVVEKYNIKTKIAHNNFQTKEEAEEYIKQLEEKNSDKKYEIKNVSEIKKLYNEYIKGLEVKVPEQETKIKVVEKLIKPPEKKVFKTNPEFKEKFLNANNSFYTINVSSFTDLDALEEFINKNKIYEESFFFKYGNSGELLKLVTGIYEDYTNIEEIINKLILENENVFPIVEKISSVKKQYNDNLIFNENKLYKSNLSEKLNKKEEADQLAKRLVKIEADKKAKEEAERQAKLEAEKKAKEETERLAKIEAEKKAKEETERLAKLDADKKAKEEAERQAKLEAEKKAKEETERLAKIEAEKKAKEETERLAKLDADKKAKEEAERLAKIEAEKKAKEEAERLAKIEAEKKAKEEAERLAKIEAEKKAKEEAERLAKIEADKKAKEKAERQAKLEAEKKAKEEAERLAKIEAEKKAKEEAERLAKIEADKKAKEKAERLAKLEAEKKAKEEAERLAKIEAEKKAKEEAERLAKIEVDKKAKEKAERLAKIEADKKAKEEAERQAKIEAEQKAKEEAERLVKIKAEKKAKEEAEKNPKYTRPQTTSIEEVDFGTKVKDEFIPYKKRLENFRDEFKTVPKDKFTLEIATLKPSEVDWFVSARAVGPYYVVRDASNKVKLYYGIYETKEEAKKATETLHPVIYESNPPIKQIGSVR
ncbi:TolC family protein [Campylobacterota bacterium DY0563]